MNDTRLVASFDYGGREDKHVLRLGDAWSGEGLGHPSLIFVSVDGDGPSSVVHLTTDEARAIRKDLKKRIRAIDARTT